jgi:hypothetical protein
MVEKRLVATADAQRVEAPVTLKAYLMCAFAAFGGMFFGYDSGYINSVMGMNYFVETIQGLVCASSLRWREAERHLLTVPTSLIPRPPHPHCQHGKNR